jgi:hypothetical protein
LVDRCPSGSDVGETSPPFRYERRTRRRRRR